MKSNSIIAFFLGAILVLTLSSAESVFADYDEQYDEQYDESERYEDSKSHENKDKDCEKDDSEDDDRYEKERS